MKNIYIVGKAGSGKSTVATFLVEKYGYQVAKFAYPVYNLAYNYFDMKGKDRRLLQVLGTDIGRGQIDNNLWVTRFLQDMLMVEGTRKKLNLPTRFFILDDCRFINEHKLLKDMGWCGIYLDVPEDIRIQRLTGRDVNACVECLNHTSEVSVDVFKDDLIKVNANCSVEEMNLNVVSILEVFNVKEI